jgi:iron complex outermembrane recepter protein
MCVRQNHSQIFALAVLALLSFTAGAAEPPARTVAFDIPAKPLNLALTEFAQQSGLQVVFVAEIGRDLSTSGLTGNFTPQAALDQLLANTPFAYDFLNPHTVTIRAIKERDGKPVAQGMAGEGEMTLAQADSASASTTASTASESTEAPANAADDKDDAGGIKLEEVVVTAQKREERLQDVPVPVTVISGETLADNHLLRIEDYYSMVPGLSIALAGSQAGPEIVIRGLTTGVAANPTVAVVVDDIPYNTSVAADFNIAPDIDPNDMRALEVLRGPQGTLFGASSLGGLMKYTMNEPSLDRASGRLQAGAVSVASGDVGHNLRAMANIPLTETFAIRASGFTMRDPGYIDNLISGRRDVNFRDSDGGRLTGLWVPSDRFSLKLSALFQRSDRGGSADSFLAPGSATPLTQRTGGLTQQSTPGTGIYERESQIYNATLRASFGAVQLTSLTGYVLDESYTVQDETSTFFSGLGNSIFPGTTGHVAFGFYEPSKLTHETRAEIPIGGRLSWLLGVFYTDEDYPSNFDRWAADRTTGARVGRTLDIATTRTYDEQAAFSNLTVKVTDRFDIQFGGRISDIEAEIGTALRTGPLVPNFFGGTSPSIGPGAKGKDSPFTYLVTPQLKLSPDLMLYARLASGYRPGAINVNCGVSPVIPCLTKADTTQNYEIGAKGSVLGGRLSYDAALYHIDWTDVQLRAVVPGTNFGYTDNGGRGKSEGVELSIEARPLTGLTLSGWVALNRAELTENFSTFRKGQKFPFNPELSSNVSIKQELPLGSTGAIAFLGGSASYVDERPSFIGDLVASFPSYVKLNLNAGLEYETWRVDTFVNNVNDKRVVLGTGGFIPNVVYYMQPRTMGLSVTKTFE